MRRRGRYHVRAIQSDTLRGSCLAPTGAFRTFQKDIDTVAATAYKAGTPMPVSSTVQQLLRLGAAMGLADADLSAFIDVLQTPRGA